MLIVRPLGGLCNRLRTISSAYELANSTGSELKIIWDIDNHSLHAPFFKLFKSVPGITIEENYIDSKSKFALFLLKRFWITNISATFISQPFLYKTIDEKWSEEKLKIYFEEHLKNNKNLYVECCWDFYPINKKYYLFKPVEELQKIIDVQSRKLNSDTIGIHIRRTDHTIAIKESPLELFLSKIKNLSDQNAHANFFLATDDKEVEDTFNQLFEGRIMTYSDHKSRSSDEGVQQAVIDLFLLSKTKKIIGSFWSSFSMAAAEIGGIELEVVVAKAPNQ